MTKCRTNDKIFIYKDNYIWKGCYLMDKQETRLTVRVPSERYNEFKVKCAVNNETITEVIRRSVRNYCDGISTKSMDDATFNATMFGYIKYSMEKSGYSYEDISKIINCINVWGINDLTLKEAEKYQNDIFTGEKSLSHTDMRSNRIAERED